LIQAKVIYTWQKLWRRERKEIRRRSMRASDAVMRCRCTVILGLVQGKTPTMIARGGLCAKSQVYRVADQFIEHGLVGLADRREDNGENKVTDTYGMELLRLIEGWPQEHGYSIEIERDDAHCNWYTFHPRIHCRPCLELPTNDLRGGVSAHRVSISALCNVHAALSRSLHRPKTVADPPHWRMGRKDTHRAADSSACDGKKDSPCKAFPSTERGSTGTGGCVSGAVIHRIRPARLLDHGKSQYSPPLVALPQGNHRRASRWSGALLWRRLGHRVACRQ
jgi:hypothetical protein